MVTPVEVCGGDSTPVQLRIQNCEGAPPCTLFTNTDILIEIDWWPSSDFDDATLDIQAETSVGNISLLGQDVSGPGGQLSTLGGPVRISNALSGQSINITGQVQSSDLMLCVRFLVQLY